MSILVGETTLPFSFLPTFYESHLLKEISHSAGRKIFHCREEPVFEGASFQGKQTGNHNTVELQRLEHLWDYENLFEAGVVRAIDGL